MSRGAVLALQVLGLSAFWLLISDQHSPLFLGMGAVSVALVTALTHRLVLDVLPTTDEVSGSALGRVWAWVILLSWLVQRIIVSSAQVAYFVLHPRMPIEPARLTFRTSLRSRMARVILANTITLVPGTFTLRLDDDKLLVHALVPSAAADLIDATMQNRIGAVFGEPFQQAPVVIWDPPDEVVR